MARVIAGKITGKVGDLIFSNRNGVNYVRRVSKKTPKAPTLKQLIQREKFGMVMHFLSPIKGILRETFNSINQRSSGMTAAAKQILAEAITGEYPNLKIDFSKISLIRGYIRMPDPEMIYNADLNELQVRWTYSDDCLMAYPDDELLALIYCPSVQIPWQPLKSGAFRYEQSAIVKVPEQMKGNEFHVWLYYYSHHVKSFSGCFYNNMLCTEKPADHENV